MHSLAPDECDKMSFCLFKALDFDLYGVFHSLLYVCLHYTNTVPLQPMNEKRNVSSAMKCNIKVQRKYLLDCTLWYDGDGL